MTEEVSTDADRTANQDKCCENPSVSKVPERRFKLPGNTYRETRHKCLNCGTLLE